MNKIKDQTDKTGGLTIRAVGDISFEGRRAHKPDITVFNDVRSFLQSGDLVLANLENPLTINDEQVPGKCTLHGHPGWAKVLKEAGINLVSLANNHLMDYGPQGLSDTIKTLDSAGIQHVGAGNNEREAKAPLFLNIRGYHLAILARSSVIVSSPCYAGPSAPGVAFLNEKELSEQIRSCRNKADLVMVILHWGLEEYHYPAPAQIALARELVNAGADAIIGHHPHVVQGIQTINGKAVVYSLGNFLFDEFNWNSGSDDREMRLTLSEANRRGMILQMDWDADNYQKYSPVFTRINEATRIMCDEDPGRTEEFNALSKALERKLYSVWWRIYSLKREWDLRFRQRYGLGNLIKKIYKIRLNHLTEFYILIRRSLKITKGKTTNPYE